MVRLAVFVLLLLAGVVVAGGLADAFALSVFVPEIPAILTTHLAWSGVSLPFGLALAVLAGYVEDLDAGGIVGLSSLAYAVAFLGTYRLARRIAAPGTVGRVLWSAAFVAVVDAIVAAGIAAVLPWIPAGYVLSRSTWAATGLHVAATALWAPAVWVIAEAVHRKVGLARTGLSFEDGGSPP